MNFHKNSAEYNLAGEINRESVLSLCDFIDVSIHYYCYDVVKIRIDSPGGQIAYLNHYLYKINELNFKTRKGQRQFGRNLIITTEGLSVVASAAAVLMSLGSAGYRTCCKTCQLCYHGTRVQLDGGITKEKADKLYHRLKEEDELIIDQLVELAVLSISENFSDRIRNNHVYTALSKDHGRKGKPFDFGSGFRKEYKFLKRLYDNILKKQSFDNRARSNLKNRLKVIYHKLFANDVFINSDEAQFLLLVDQII